MTMCSFVVRMELFGRPVANVLWFDVDSPYSADLQSVVDQVGAAYTTNLLGHMTGNLTLIDCLVRIWDGDGPFSAAMQPAVFPETGNGTGQAVPANVALLISTSHAGPRPNRGRIYIPGLEEVDWDGDSWNATMTGLAEAFADDLMAIPEGAFSIARPNVATNTAIGHRVHEAVVRGFAGSQRGRRF